MIFSCLPDVGGRGGCAEIKRGIFTALPSLTMGAAKPKAGLGGKAGGVGGKGGALGGGWGGGTGAKTRALPAPRA